MKQNILAILLSLSCPAMVIAADVSFSLENAVSVAIARSPKIRSLEAKLQELEADRGAARSEFLPRVGVAAGIEKNPAYAENSERLAYGYASWNIFNGFADRRATQMASFEVSKAELELASAKFALALEVEARFFKILGVQKSFGEWHDASQLNGAALKDVRMRRGAGMASEGDYVAFEVRQSRIESELMDAKSAVEIEKTSFNRLLGHDIGQAVTFSGQIPRFELNEPGEQIIVKAHEKSFALKESAIDVAKSDVETAKWLSGVLPKVDLEARNGWLPLGERPTSTASKNTPSTYLILTAKMDLFSGLSTLNERRAAIARKTQSDEKLREASAELLSQVEQHVRKLLLMEKRLLAEAENVKKTTKFKETTSREYRAGVKTGLDYASAIDMAIDSRRRYVDSLLTWHEVRFGLEKALGRRVAVKEVMGEVK
jgi:outer membrane protein TolC